MYGSRSDAGAKSGAIFSQVETAVQLAATFDAAFPIDTGRAPELDGPSEALWNQPGPTGLQTVGTVTESESGFSRSENFGWMRMTLDTV